MAEFNASILIDDPAVEQELYLRFTNARINEFGGFLGGAEKLQTATDADRKAFTEQTVAAQLLAFLVQSRTQEAQEIAARAIKESVEIDHRVGNKKPAS